MKKIITLGLVLFSLGCITHAEPLTPEQFLETYSHSDSITRHYFGNFFLTIGLPTMGSSILLKDDDNKSSALIIGSVYSGVGALIKLIPTELESKYKKLGDKSALESVKELRNTQKTYRYIAAAAFAIPILFDYSGEKTVSHPHPEDANITIKTMLASASIGMLIFKTPLEQLCEDVIAGQNKPNFSLYFTPGIDQTSLTMVYRF